MMDEFKKYEYKFNSNVDLQSVVNVKVVNNAKVVNNPKVFNNPKVNYVKGRSKKPQLPIIYEESLEQLQQEREHKEREHIQIQKGTLKPIHVCDITLVNCHTCTEHLCYF